MIKLIKALIEKYKRKREELKFEDIGIKSSKTPFIVLNDDKKNYEKNKSN